MVLSYYLLKIPYTIVWEVRNILGLNKDIMLYCANALDYQIFSSVQKHILNNVKVIAKDKKAQQELEEIGVESVLYPAFPKGVIMCRQAGYKFPASRMIKVGMRHGAYTFKPFANTKGYNLLDYFYMTSNREVERAKDKGINCGLAIGFPKLDPFFDGSITSGRVNEIRADAGIDNARPTILFTATWNDSGISAVNIWFDKLASLTKKYNLLVTVHPWTSTEIKHKIATTKGVYLIKTVDVVPYIKVADICIGDTSSILAECCALDKPIITFKVADGKRTDKEVKQLISEFTTQINSLDELDKNIELLLTNPDMKKVQRANANKVMFDVLDGKAGLRAANHLKKIFPSLDKK
jgi:CDP-glycerol glycerophosphotransferase (TagB/SpsB family)